MPTKKQTLPTFKSEKILKATSKAGRKPKPEGEKLTETIACKFTPAEKEKLLEAAGGIPLATWARNLILSNLK